MIYVAKNKERILLNATALVTEKGNFNKIE